MTPSEAGATIVTVDDLALGVTLCADPTCRCELVLDTPTTPEVEARLHWWLAGDGERGEG